MIRYCSIFITIFLVSLTVIALGGDYAKGEQRPMDHERLQEPIVLKDSCHKIRIIEWRPTLGYTNFTSPTKNAVGVVNATCNIVVKNFYKFVKLKGYNPKRVEPDTSLSFIPADLKRHGSSPRNLNDLKYRFAYRTEQSALWGWFQRDFDWAYIRNDVLKDNGEVNDRFITITAHELFHAMSYASGVFNQHPKANRDQIEERMARDFTEYIGFGR